MQTIKFNIISRADWEVLSNKQFGYFYFVVDNVEVLDAGGDLYLGENLIGSGLTIEEIVEYFENPANEHTFPGITAGDILPRGNTEIDVTERLGIKMQRNTRYIKDGPAQLVGVGGVTYDYDSDRILKYGLNPGYGEWRPTLISSIYISGDNFLNTTILSDYSIDSTHLVIPVVKGVEGKYGSVDLGQNNGYVVTGGKENYVGWCSLENFSGQLSDFTQLQYRRLSGQPVEDSTKYWFPEDDGWLCIGFTAQPQMSQDGTVTVDGVEVGCHLAMDNKKDNEAGKANGNLIQVYWNTTPPTGPDNEYIGQNGYPVSLAGIRPSDTGYGVSDVLTFDENTIKIVKKTYQVPSSELSWVSGTSVYDESLGTYLWTWSATIEDMKENGSVATIGGYENSFKDAYSDGNSLVVIGYGSSDSPYNYPSEELDSVVYELDVPIEASVGQPSVPPIVASKYGVIATLDGSGVIPEEYGVFLTMEYQQSGGDQIWDAIAYQKELAEVTAAALTQLNSNIQKIPEWMENDYDSDPDYLTFTAKAASAISMGTQGSAPTVNIEYSKNNGSWESLGSTQVSLASGDNIRLRGLNSSMASSTNDYNYFVMSGELEASGDVTSLLNNVGGVTEISTDYCFCGLFRNCSSLITPPDLPSTTVSKYCYSYMFSGCTSLKQAPALPANNLDNSCYYYMFNVCRSLVVAPVLNATKLAMSCYAYMFNDCTNLSIVQETLQNTKLYRSCYYHMFDSCTSLKKAPVLPATEVQQLCYSYMFSGCTSLSIVQETLPATTLASSCYGSMFSGCSSLEKAPVLPATELVTSCYINMFANCSRLKYVKAMFTTEPANAYTSRWLYKVPSVGTFVKNSSATWTTTGANAVPNGWTVEFATE
jgi:hypothetical protein